MISKEKAEIFVMLNEIEDERKQELIEKYKCDLQPMGPSAAKMVIGNALNDVTRMMIKGATAEELHQAVEHLEVCILNVKHNLDLRKSYEDHHIDMLKHKYFAIYKKEETADGTIFTKVNNTPEERRKMMEKRDEARKKLKEKVQNYLDSGCAYEYIADELMMPESTIRSIMKE